MRKYLILLLLLVSAQIYSQIEVDRDSVNTKMQKSINSTNNASPFYGYSPPSPNASSLGIFGNIPVGHYSGVPDITIPLYEIKSGSITLPINLSYHASGIRISQESSWVGLGWALNAGGIITRTVRGLDDFNNYGKYPRAIGYIEAPPIQFDMLTSTWEDPKLPSGYVDGWEYLTYVHVENSMGVEDSEPDFFQYNFGGYSGQMIFEKQKGPNYRATILNQDPIEVFYQSDIKEWKVITPNGMRFYFKTKEMGSSYCGATINSDYHNLVWKQPDTPTSWYLDRIEDKNDRIDLFYITNARIKGVGSASFSSTHYNVVYQADHMYRESLLFHSLRTEEVLLTGIKFKDGYIDFQTQDRYDLGYTGNRVPQALKEINIRNNKNDNIQSYKFHTNYFGETHDQSNSDFLRLCLLSIEDKQGNRHKFSYNPLSLPSKTSTSTDHWGYYNGQANPTNTDGNRTYLPSMWAKGIKNVLEYYPGSNFDANNTAAQASVLQRIDYPTGGYTNFEYSIHHFNPYASGSNEIINQKTEMVFPGAYLNQVSEAEFELDMDTNVKWTVHATLENSECGADGNTYVRFNQYKGNNFKENDRYCILQYKAPGSNTWDGTPIKYFQFNHIKCGQLSDGLVRSYTWEQKIYPLKKGHYKLTVIGYNATRASSIITYNRYIKPAESAIGGGLRIKTITHYDGKSTFSTNYNYSLGVMITPPIYCFHREYHALYKSSATGELAEQYVIHNIKFSRSIRDLQVVGSGNYVGYSRVDEINKNMDGNTSGTTTYAFHVLPHTIELSEAVPPNMRWSNNLSNGRLLSITNFNADNVKVKEINYKWESKNRKFVKSLMLAHIGGCFYILSPYDTISERWHVKSEETIDYPKSGIPLVQNKLFEYDPLYHQIRKEEKINSDGLSSVTEYKYSFDFHTSEVYKNMVKNNIISPVVEQLNLYNGKLLSKQVVNYIEKTGGIEGKLYVPNSIETYTQNLRNMNSKVELHNYDSYGNLLFASTEVKKLVYIWSYQGERLIAKIENATYEQVSPVVKEIFGMSIEDLSTQKIVEEDKLKALRGHTSLINSHVYSFSYKPLVGMVVATTPAGVTTYYNYDIYGRLKDTAIRERDITGKESNNIIETFLYHFKTNK